MRVEDPVSAGACPAIAWATADGVGRGSSTLPFTRTAQFLVNIQLNLDGFFNLVHVRHGENTRSTE